MVYPDEIDMQTYFQLCQRQPPCIIEPDSIEAQRDAVGYTNPNLHRRIDPQQPTSPMTKPNSYNFTIQNNNSYRIIHVYTHDEDSITTEIP